MQYNITLRSFSSVKEFLCSTLVKTKSSFKISYHLWFDRPLFLSMFVTSSFNYRHKRTQGRLTHDTSLSPVILESASPDFKQSYLLRVTKSAVLLIKCPTEHSFSYLDSASRPRHPHCWGLDITLRNTKLGRNSLSEWSARRKDLYLTTPNTYKTHTHTHTHTRRPRDSN